MRPVPSKTSLAFVSVIIFVSCFVYNQYTDDRISYEIQSNDHPNLEIILEQIPVCTSYDRYRQRNLLKMLIDWDQFASKHRIQYWIAYGTLVGYVQRRGLLPHDEDIDVVILGKDTERLVPFVTRNFSSKYDIKVHPRWYIPGYQNRSYYSSKGIDFIAPNARFTHRLLHYHIDIWPIYEYHPDHPKNQTTTRRTLTDYNSDYEWSSTPRHWTFPLKRCEFSGIQVWCPAMPEKLVEKTYGASALNESDTRCVDGSWIP